MLDWFVVHLTFYLKKHGEQNDRVNNDSFVKWKHIHQKPDEFLKSIDLKIHYKQVINRALIFENTLSKQNKVLDSFLFQKADLPVQ